MHFEALEQTLRLRLVSGPVDKKFFFISRNSLSRTVHTYISQDQAGPWCTQLQILDLPILELNLLNFDFF